MTRPLLDVRNVTRRFGGLVANSEITFSVAPGEIIGLIGPNGAGKTTLFNVLVGIYPPSSGEVIFDGKPIGGLKPHRIAAAGLTKTFQNVALFAESTVLDNVVTGGLVNRSLSDARAFAVETLERVGIGAIADKKAGDLSFPERARVEVARALCTSPKLLLLDEVMAALTRTTQPTLPLMTPSHGQALLAAGPPGARLSSWLEKRTSLRFCRCFRFVDVS